MTQTDDIETLLNGLFPFAEKMLREHGAFFPFGGHIKAGGELALDSAQAEEDHPQPQELIDRLRDSFRQRATNDELRACAIVHDVRVVPPGRSETQDAICASIDHVDGYSAHVFVPYSFPAPGELVIEEGYALDGDATVFPPER
ncbi:MAG TPA: hypothetical protein VGD42_00110 [Lysobacter sp.]